jgi:uncharacterized protein YfiM (DUF2279 family)
VNPFARLAATAALVAVVVAPPRDSWLGVDKIKHFLMSALVHSTAFSIARSAGMHRGGAQVAGAMSAATIGVLKEVHDRRVGKPFSIPDLFWDGVGTVSSAALLNRSR